MELISCRLAAGWVIIRR